MNRMRNKGWLMLFEVTLLNSKQCKELFGTGSLENKITLSSVLKKADHVTKSVLYNTFFENPDKDIIGAIKILKDPIRINYVSEISKAYYNKHVGKFVKDERERIQKGLEKELTCEFAKIDWPKIAHGGNMGKIKCLNCGKILESKYTHDLVSCGCSNETFVDGGNDYIRVGGVNLDLIEVLEDVKKKSSKQRRKK